MLQIPFLPENELPVSGTFGKDGQKAGGEDSKVGAESTAKSSATSSASPPPKKQCSGGGDDESTVMSETDKVCIVNMNILLLCCFLLMYFSAVHWLSYVNHVAVSCQL